MGSRVKIVNMLHSPARTRAAGDLLLGQRGTVVNVLRDGTLALVGLRAGWADLPGGVRRWPVQWNDLLIYSVEGGPETRADEYRLALSGTDRDAMQHAVLLADTEHSLCGERVYPLPVCGWSLSFSPAAVRACPACVRLASEASQL